MEPHKTSPGNAQQLQAERSLQFQDLPVNQIIMETMKPANAQAQLKAMEALIADPQIPTIQVLDIGAGDGLTASVFKQVVARGKEVVIQAVEPEKKYFDAYRQAHAVKGIEVSKILECGFQQLSPEAIDGPVHVAFLSHAAYFILEDIYIASQHLPRMPRVLDPEAVKAALTSHPLTKLFDALAQGGTLVVTLGAAQELRPMTRLMTGTHGFDFEGDPARCERLRQLSLADLEAYRAKLRQGLKEPLTAREQDLQFLARMLDCHKNMLLFKRHFPLFRECYEHAHGCRLSVDSFTSQTEVDLGDYKVALNDATGLFELVDAGGAALEASHLTLRLFTHFGGWPTPEQARAMAVPEKEKDRVRTRLEQGRFLNMLALYSAGGKLQLCDETLSIRKLAA